MKKLAVIGGVVVLIGIFAALIIPMWVMTAGIGLSPEGYAAVTLMIIGCFAVGGGLMFLIFYSARKGYDDDVHHGAGPRRSDTE